MEIRNKIRFLLNDGEVELTDVSPYETLLDYLRIRARLTGTKEGCAEGDCGACTVLVGRLTGSGTLVYETVNSCIRMLATLDGTHVVTIEHLSRSGQLHPVQSAMIAHDGSQCGFCTPGIVMSLFALWQGNPAPQRAEVTQALQGNLCRCTGYASIIRAAQDIGGDPAEDPLVRDIPDIKARLEGFKDAARVEMNHSDGTVFLPSDLDDLASLRAAHPDARIIAGSTDVGLWITKDMADVAPVIHISHLNELRQVTETEEEISIGAGVSYTEFSQVIERHFPSLRGFWSRIGGVQIRNMGTIGGNIANGSPIGDTPPMLMVLGASLTLRHGQTRRTLPIEAFFISYGKQDLKPGEFIEAITIPRPARSDILEVHKISKRRDEDISSLCGAFWLRLSAGRIADIRVAFGGMAETPKRALELEAALRGRDWSEDGLRSAMPAMAADFSPISDARASAQYRMLAAQNLLLRVFEQHKGVAA